MPNVRILTDSNAYLPADLLERYPIEVIPHRLKIGGSFFEEDSDFGVDEFFEKVGEARRSNPQAAPEVQAPPVNTFLEQYQNGGYEQIVAIHMSSQLSPMWSQARKAAEMLKGRYTIRAIDSQTTSYGLGLLVRLAAEAAARGASIHDIARIVNGAVPHMYVTLFTESLGYLERSARLSASQSLLGAMLGIKAMLMMEDGRLVTQEKVQTREEVVEKLREFVSEFATIREIGVFHQGYDGIRTELIGRLRDTMPKAPVFKVDYPPSLAAYVGPSTVGVVVYEGTF